jgi:hypothetical protein
MAEEPFKMLEGWLPKLLACQRERPKILFILKL